MLLFVICEALPSHSHSWVCLGSTSPLEGIDSQKLHLSSTMEHLLTASQERINVIIDIISPLWPDNMTNGRLEGSLIAKVCGLSTTNSGIINECSWKMKEEFQLCYLEKRN